MERASVGVVDVDGRARDGNKGWVQTAEEAATLGYTRGFWARGTFLVLPTSLGYLSRRHADGEERSVGDKRGGIPPEMLLPAHHCITTPMNKMTRPTDPVISWDRRAADSSQPRLFCHAAVSISLISPLVLQTQPLFLPLLAFPKISGGKRATGKMIFGGRAE
jgi:hypothetical protein